MKFSASFGNALLSSVVAAATILALQTGASADKITIGDLESMNPGASVGGYAVSGPSQGFAPPIPDHPAHDDPDLGDIVHVEATGSLDGAAVYGMFVALNKSVPAFMDAMEALRLNAPIDDLWLNSNHPGRVAMDNPALTATPIPAALPLFATALALGAWFLRRRKASKAACRSTQR